MHLLLDSLACPYLDKTKRAELLRDSWNKIGTNFGSISAEESEALTDEIQLQHWFVRWDGVDLLNSVC